MKNLMLVLFVMTAMVFTNDLQAQATCTPAQAEACKKICGDQAKCTPEQIAACKKTCLGKSESGTAIASAVKVVNEAPAKSASCQKSCTKTSTASATNDGLVKLVGLEIAPETKKTGCSKSSAAKKE